MTIEKMYGSYSDADLNDWERFPMNANVLTSSAFGAWLLRRDERRDERRDTSIKADYEKRIKADVVDILTVLLLKIQSESNKIPYDEENTVQFKLGQGNAYDMCKYLIQERINTLKAESEEV